MITIELTEQQLKDVTYGIELLIRESEEEFSKLRFVGCDSKIAKMFKQDIKEMNELKQYLKKAYENN